MKTIKILFAFFVIYLGINNQAQATHFAGGEIWYEYAGNAQFPNRYDVFVIIYRDVSGADLCPFWCPADICITSSCFPTINVVAPLLPFNLKAGSDTLPGSFPGSIQTPDLLDCVNSNSPGLVLTEAYRFYTQVDLPSSCSDVRFSYSENARNTSDNMTTSGNFTIFADLNSTLGPNTSPKFVNPAAKSFCAGTPFIWSQAALEPDGDSIFYEFGIPYEGNCINPTQMTFKNGYSKNSPMTTLGPILFNNKTGVLRFTAAQQEVVVINIKVTEYRNSPPYGWAIIGSSVRDLQIPVVSGQNCNPSALSGPQFSAGTFPPKSINSDSLKKEYSIIQVSNSDSFPDPNNPGKYLVNLPVLNYSCFDSTITVHFDDGVYCETIATNGSDFRLIGPDKSTRPVVGVKVNCRTDLVTQKLDLKLHKPLDVNGDYLLQIKKGDDGNTLTNKCGFALESFYSLIVRVNDCPTPSYNLNNVTVYNDVAIDINWELDMNSIEPSLFTGWNILRANENDQFHIIETLDAPTDLSLRSYRDASLMPINIDLSKYQYRVQLVQNGRYIKPTNRIYSILLEDSVIEEGVTTQYKWNEYEGWPQGAYEFQLGVYDSLASPPQFNWTSQYGPKEQFHKQDYDLPLCTISEENGGLYAVRIICTDQANPANPFSSMSNWVYFEVKCDLPPSKPNVWVDVPNVFTPNNDGENDVFHLSGGGYQEAEISIYNRWGKAVYEGSGNLNEVNWDGKDYTTGRKVASGVYYYVIDLEGNIEDGNGGTEHIQKNLNGSVSVFSSAVE